MNCHESLDILQHILDGESHATGRQVVDAHLKECTACRELYDSAGRLLMGLKQMPAIAPPSGLAEQVVARLRRERQPLVLRPRFLMGAAAAVFAVGFGLWASRSVLLDQKPHDPGTALAVVEPHVAKPALEVPFEEVGSATLGLTRQVVEDTAESAALLVPPADRFPSSVLPAPIEPSAVPLREVGQSVAAGLEPVTSSARRAWDMLVRELPPVEGR